MSYYNGTITNGLVLSSLAQNPATVGPSGYVTNNTTLHFGDAVYGSTATSWNFTNLGRIKATRSASAGVELRAGGTVTNKALAQISGDGDGVRILGSSGTVSNFGTISGIGVPSSGVRLLAGGTVANGSGGVILSVLNGIEVDLNAGTISNLGTIQSTGAGACGIFLVAGGDVTNAPSGLILSTSNGVAVTTALGSVTNFGTIEGTGLPSDGVHLFAGGNVTNGGSSSPKALIVAASSGVEIGSNPGSVSNFGTIQATSTSGFGILLSAGGTIVNNVNGFITGAAAAEIQNAVGTVTNLGSIQATGPISDGVRLLAGGLVTNGATGSTNALIVGVLNGIEVDAATTVGNFGTIQGTGTHGAGFFLTASGTVINNRNGLVTGTLNGAAIGGQGGGTVFNDGTIQGTGPGSGGGFLIAGGTVINNLTGRITGINDGLEISQTSGMVTNFGAIVGVGPQSFGVWLQAGGNLTNNSTGTIEGAYEGVLISGTTGAVVNFGNIVARATNGVGVELSSGSVTNFGVIQAGAKGTGVSLLSGNVINYGTIIASSSAAVSVRSGTFVNHQGLIIGQSSGIELSEVAGSAVSGVSVSGTVIGSIGIVVSPGTGAAAGGATLGTTIGQNITVVGTVIGTSGTAVLLNGGNDRLIVAPGALFQGKVDGGGGNSVVQVAASGGGTGMAGPGEGLATAYVNLGSVTNFSGLQVDPSAAMDAGGSLVFDTLVNKGRINLAGGDSLAVGAAASGGGAGVINLKDGASLHFVGAVDSSQTVLFEPPGGALVLDHPEQFGAAITKFASGDLVNLPLGKASFQQYAGGILNLVYGGGSVGLRLATAYSTPQFLFSDDGHGGTDILVSPLSAPTLLPASDSGARGDNITNVTSPVITGTGAAGDTVMLLDGTTRIGSATVDGTGKWSVTSSKLADGKHVLIATEIDATGNVSPAPAVLTLTIDTSAAAPAGLTLDPGSDSGTKGDNSTNVTTPVITGSGEADATLTLLDGATKIGSATVDGAGKWSITSSALAVGKHSLTATEVDVAGNASPASAPLPLSIEAGGGPANVITGTAGDDTLTGTAGADTIQGLAGNDTLIGLGGADTLDGGPGTDTADYSKDGANGGANSVVADLSKTFPNLDGFGATDVLISIENLTGTNSTKFSDGKGGFSVFGDVLIGDGGANVINGLAGPDYLDGGAGDDTITGDGALVGGLGNDTINGGTDNDVILTGDYKNPTAADGNDIAHGGAGNDLLWGYGGNDQLFGGDGNDALVGNDFGSAVTGTDTLFGESGDDTFFVGLGGSATMDGGAGNDKFFGGPGDDVLIGGAGSDFMYGAGGADTFIFHAADLVSGDSDIVYFFSASDGDTLQFDAASKGGLTVSNTTLTDFQSGASVASVFITNNAGWSASVYGINVGDLGAHTVFV